MAAAAKSIRRRALRLQQTVDHPLYLFSMTGHELLRLADISRISRDDAGKLIGYQRPEVRKHIQDIVDYLNSDQLLFPNSIILALSSRVRFIRSRGPEVDDGCASAGSIVIPLPRDGEAKPAWIVDGQQRAVALSKSKRGNLAIPVSAFVADEVDLQRDQFLRVNNAKPLPRGLITELLPEVSTSLPMKMAAKRIPSAICDWLNQTPASPFFGLIRRASTPDSERSKAVITDTSIVKMIEESLSSPSGCLFPFRNIATAETDFDGICRILVLYWSAVRKVFPNAWGKTPDKTRLMHGVGIRAMGRLMDRIIPSVNVRNQRAAQQMVKELNLIRPICRWTSGHWEAIGDLKWNEVQNVPRHINILSNVLVRAYLQAKGLAP